MVCKGRQCGQSEVFVYWLKPETSSLSRRPEASRTPSFEQFEMIGGYEEMIHNQQSKPVVVLRGMEASGRTFLHITRSSPTLSCSRILRADVGMENRATGSGRMLQIFKIVTSESFQHKPTFQPYLHLKPVTR